MSVLPVALPLIILLRVDSLYADPQSEPFRLSLALVLALLLTTRRSFPQALAACASLFVITLSLMLLFGAYITRYFALNYLFNYSATFNFIILEFCPILWPFFWILSATLIRSRKYSSTHQPPSQAHSTNHWSSPVDIFASDVFDNSIVGTGSPV